jgi:hypothetical protein
MPKAFPFPTICTNISPLSRVSFSSSRRERLLPSSSQEPFRTYSVLPGFRNCSLQLSRRSKIQKGWNRNFDRLFFLGVLSVPMHWSSVKDFELHNLAVFHMSYKLHIRDPISIMACCNLLDQANLAGFAAGIAATSRFLP